MTYIKEVKYIITWKNPNQYGDNNKQKFEDSIIKPLTKKIAQDWLSVRVEVKEEKSLL